jgi:hypothetical protein
MQNNKTINKVITLVMYLANLQKQVNGNQHLFLTRVDRARVVEMIEDVELPLTEVALIVHNQIPTNQAYGSNLWYNRFTSWRCALLLDEARKQNEALATKFYAALRESTKAKGYTEYLERIKTLWCCQALTFEEWQQRSC